MKVYSIELPYVSNGLRKTYKKKLEVYSGTIKDHEKDNNCIYADTLHEFKKGVWVEKKYSKTFKIPIKHVYTAMPNIDLYRTSQVSFNSFELAKAYKLLAIQNMAEKYHKELRSLQELFERNVPDVSEAVNEIKENFPEYFL